MSIANIAAKHTGRLKGCQKDGVAESLPWVISRRHPASAKSPLSRFKQTPWRAGMSALKGGVTS